VILERRRSDFEPYETSEQKALSVPRKSENFSV
jgi:hypothetical protein